MKSNWIRVHSCNKLHEVEIIKAFLLDNNIHSFTVNKTDSMNKYLANGEIEIFVEGINVIRARKLLSNKQF